MWKNLSFENDLMLGMRDNLRKNAEDVSPKRQLSKAIDLLDEASRLFEEAGHPDMADQILNLLNDAVIEANVLPFPKEENDLMNAKDSGLRDSAVEWVNENFPDLDGEEYDQKVSEAMKELGGKDLCPLCQTDHSNPNNPCDYEECGYCGFDHGYEYEAASKWHQENDPKNDLYSAKDKGSKVNLHTVRKWMSRNKNRDDFRDPSTGELNHTRLAEECANELDLYLNKSDYAIPEEIFGATLQFE